MGNTELWQAMTSACLADENSCTEKLRSALPSSAIEQLAISAQAANWIATIRQDRTALGSIEALLLEYPLNTREGAALMCLAEALPRTPNAVVADQLIRDLLNPIDWENHQHHSESYLVNAASWGLALTGRWLTATEQSQNAEAPWHQQLNKMLGEPVLRSTLKKAMHYLAEQFVVGENLSTALKRTANHWGKGETHSFDMLGEAALTQEDSARYLQAYRDAIEQVGRNPTPPTVDRPSISIKLSALHPRYHTQYSSRLQQELLPQLIALVEQAAAAKIELTIDAEEADRLELSLKLFERLFAQVTPAARDHIGLAVQAYGKRAWPALHWLQDLAARYSTRLKIRLVKGAYWDTEIKRAQQRGLHNYPVFTSKTATDISYLACAHFLLEHPQQFFPQFATHNAITIAAILQLQKDLTQFEFQRLQGMGENLYRTVRAQYPDLRCRIYAPVGAHRDLLPYLVRRLLENGANTSFIHQLHDTAVDVETLTRHPLHASSPSTSIPTPPDLWLPQRYNSPGLDLHNEQQHNYFFGELNRYREKLYCVDMPHADKKIVVHNPYDHSEIGYWHITASAHITVAAANARKQQPSWEHVAVDTRAACIERYAELLIENRAELVALMARETGKTLENGLDEIREAVDFCRYYAQQARELLANPLQLPSVTGEENQLRYCARGVFVCISPWNFPVAIFTGQIVAALVAGNAVLAKPTEQATLSASFATELMHRAGIPTDIVQLLPGPGETIGQQLCANQLIDGVVFTGGWETGRAIQRQLAQREGAMIPFIAETAGLNAMIADSSAQPQQLVNDVMRSAFDSAGQRCSALRVLYLPESCAESIEHLLFGAMQQLQLGDPLLWSTDIGPVIDQSAREELLNYVSQQQKNQRVLFQVENLQHGLFVAPTVIRLQHLNELQHEAFGPILHIIRYREQELGEVIDAINNSGFGLTCGIHSRNEKTARHLAEQLHVGNIYINRDMIGAVVGAQPFGGRGKSGTGPKAGGPNYLLRFTAEKTVTLNTAALGGDYQLLAK